jgi:hypothetical protein
MDSGHSRAAVPDVEDRLTEACDRRKRVDADHRSMIGLSSTSSSMWCSGYQLPLAHGGTGIHLVTSCEAPKPDHYSGVMSRAEAADSGRRSESRNR